MKSQTLYIDTLDETVLWRNLKEGDEKAFSFLFEKYYGHLVRYGNSFSPFPEKVQDCVQDVFTDVWVYRQSLNDSVVVKAYLLSSVRKRIARLQERDHIFRKTTSMDSIEFLFDFSVEHQLISDEATEEKVSHLNELLNNLPTRQKEALYLRYHQGLSVEQIADMLQVNYQSANNLLHRAVVNLRKEWKGDLSLLFLLSSSLF
ncbi:RNA polymerase sigma factor [Flavobacterium sinopsychrotolerans]|jgi:RNA polymerase sigma factor (sigma-70 family)|uniref:RNA polymerase sigma factor, sigma-70 family n=1 Tax=Flavobacterium sinopsychrotolerans TaxID=604089 RepID=A0A1H8KF00_9FLAO|nr:sigma-70 family RNA polymerase sigma factor [Flavobacterium sinopsychrotolerans]SEN91146.1 RNA polymerase sigma factor, sigma-70 family [Flavobacterium sinopsychrotolerans]